MSQSPPEKPSSDPGEIAPAARRHPSSHGGRTRRVVVEAPGSGPGARDAPELAHAPTISASKEAATLQDDRPRDRAPERWDAARLPVVDARCYDVAGAVAQGGIGRVLRATDRRLGRSVAIKELLDARPDAEERFVREAVVTARLQHPSIVPIYEAGR